MRALVWSMCLAGCSVVFDTDRHNGDAGIPGDVMLADVREAIPAARLCPVLAEPYCEARANCCATPPESMNECILEFTGNCSDTLGRWVIDPRVGYDEEEAQRALDTFRAAASTCDVDSSLELFTYGLLDVLGGTIAEGGECTPTLSDVLPAVSCQESECLSNGLFAAWTCGEPRADGGACVTYLECSGRLRCDARAFMCAPQLANGESCGSGVDCESLFCRRITPGADGACSSASVQCECAEAMQGDVYCGPLLELPELPTGRMDG